MLLSTSSLKFRQLEIDGANGEYNLNNMRLSQHYHYAYVALLICEEMLSSVPDWSTNIHTSMTSRLPVRISIHPMRINPTPPIAKKVML
jgi:hypothetical protein